MLVELALNPKELACLFKNIRINRIETSVVNVQPTNALAVTFIDRKVFLLASAATLPWFAAMSLVTYQLAVALTTTVTVATCDPAFVAQMPGSNGALIKIGHFDEVDGVVHVEI